MQMRAIDYDILCPFSDMDSSDWEMLWWNVFLCPQFFLGGEGYREHWPVVHFDMPVLSNTEKELFFLSYSSRLNVVSTKNDTKYSENISLDNWKIISEERSVWVGW